MQHLDVSGSDEQDGYKYTYVTYPLGGNKAEANPHEPLKAATLEHLQELVTAPGDAFYAAVAEGRGVNLAKVNTWGRGRVFDASEALRLGMIDDVTDIDGAFALLDELSGGSPAQETTMAIDEGAVDARVKAALPDALAAALPGALAAQLKPLFDEQAKAIAASQAAALEPVDGRLKAIETAQAALDASFKKSAEDTERTLTKQALQSLADNGQLAPGLVEEELEDLMCFTSERRQAKLDRMRGAKSTVPTKAAELPAATELLATADARTFGAPFGPSGNAHEAALIAQVEAEGISASDADKFLARLEVLRSEVADA
jgi:hypothetical protein